MDVVRNRLAVVAGGLLAISFVVAIEVAGVHSPAHASAWAAAAWAQQATFWLGMVAAGAAVAAWLVAEAQHRRG
jgi:hypothetical protein